MSRLPGRPVEAGWRGAWRRRLIWRAALEDGLVAAEAGAGDAALAAEDVEQARLGLAVLEVGDGLDEALPCRRRDDLAGEQVLGAGRPPAAGRG